LLINVREYRRGTQKWTTQKNWQHRVHSTMINKTKQKQNTSQYEFMPYLGCSVRLYLQLLVGVIMPYLGCSVRLYLQLLVGVIMPYLGCSVRLYLQLFVGGIMPFLGCSVRL
jgi:hypothetical protein